MEDNLIPPFIMRQRGIMVNDTPKIHCDEPSIYDHCITFRDIDLRIPLRLHGTLSFFHTRKPNDDELESYDKVFITPDESQWNPYCPSFELNEESILNYDGELTDRCRRSKHVMERESEDAYIAAVSTSDFNETVDKLTTEAFTSSNMNNDEYNHDAMFSNALNQRTEISKMMASIGSVTISDEKDSIFVTPIGGSFDELREILIDELGEETVTSVEDRVNSVQATIYKGVNKDFLSNIWLVSEDLAECDIDKNTQLCK